MRSDDQPAQSSPQSNNRHKPNTPPEIIPWTSTQHPRNVSNSTEERADTHPRLSHAKIGHAKSSVQHTVLSKPQNRTPICAACTSNLQGQSLSMCTTHQPRNSRRPGNEHFAEQDHGARAKPITTATSLRRRRSTISGSSHRSRVVCIGSSIGPSLCPSPKRRRDSRQPNRLNCAACDDRKHRQKRQHRVA